jgi:site-specific recombinase XerD
LQRRLRASAAVLDKALLLMRRTGVRSGELLDLEYACLRGDPQHHRYLKVPLGKLYNERLVPLNAETVALVQWLQQRGRRSRPRLLPVAATRTGTYRRLCQALQAVTHDFDDPQPINTHRLRHTYATELLNAGMSLPGVMRLLGHRDCRMTLRYAAVTDETVGKEYHQALHALTQKYTPSSPLTPELPNCARLLDQLARLVRSQLHAGRPVRPLLRRIERLHRDLSPILPQPPT